MNTASNALRAAPPVSAPEDYSNFKPENIRASSRGLGWSGLNFERRDSPPGVRSLINGSRQHLIFVSLGAGRITCESDGETQDHELSPGSIAVIPAGVPMKWKWSTRLSCSVLILEPEFLDRVAHEVFGLEPQDYKLVLAERAHDTAITNIAGVLAREAMLREPGGRLYAESLGNILAVHLLRHYAQCASGRTLEACSASVEKADVQEAAVSTADGGEPPARAGAVQPRAVAEALRYMHENYAQEVSLHDLADAAHLSPFHVARLFKQSLGVSPHQYLIQLRVNSARSLLAAGSGERSLAEIATAVGFADQSHLTRHFKRLLGVTPSQFRA